MKRIAILTSAILLAAAVAPVSNLARQAADTPTAAVMTFYRALKARQYVEGFRHSVYKGAVEGLSEDELKDLEPDFARTFSQIPDKIEARGEQTSGDTATVFLKFDGIEEPQIVTLVRVGKSWLVGDKETLEQVNSQGRAFFFNTRVMVNEEEAFDTIERLVGAEIIYAQRFQGQYAPMEEMLRLNALPKDVDAGGYKIALTLSEDRKSFFVTATPHVYGKTGRLSFYADVAATRAEDLKGKPATNRSPVYKRK
ncbi:MAG TPA: hypothetical protein VJQ56_00270 [Blastocatellia bacterium]|nr:hypothetical protein [Blastocatellia bacterium]